MRSVITTIGILIVSSLTMEASAVRADSWSLDPKVRVQEYCKDLAANPRLAVLKDKVPFFASDITIRHMSIERKSNPKEKKALLVLARYYQACLQARTNLQHESDNIISDILNAPMKEYQYRTEEAFLAAYRGEISLGRLNELRRRAYLKYRQDVVRTAERLLQLWQKSKRKTTKCRWRGDNFICKEY